MVNYISKSLLLTILTVIMFLSHSPVYSQYTNICNDPDVSEEESDKCEQEYNECLQNPLTLPESNIDNYNECIGNTGCNSIVRYTSYDTPEDCINWEQKLKPGTNAYDWYDEIKAYCHCVEKCNLQYYVERDCNEVLDDCCSIATMDNSKICFTTDLEVTIKKIVGEVEVQKAGEEYREAVVGETLHMGDYIATGFESTCTVIFEKVAEIDIKQMTNFAISQFFVQGNLAKTAISLRMGEVTTNVHAPKGCRAKFEIETPTSTIGSRGTTFKVRHSEETGISEFFTYKGETEVTEKITGNVVIMSKGEYLYIDDSGSISEIMDIPDNENLTPEEIAFLEEFEEASEYSNAENIESGEGENNYTTILLIGICCCFSFGLIIVFGIIVLLIRKQKKKT